MEEQDAGWLPNDVTIACLVSSQTTTNVHSCNPKAKEGVGALGEELSLTTATMFHDNRVLECMNKTDTFGK